MFDIADLGEDIEKLIESANGQMNEQQLG